MDLERRRTLRRGADVWARCAALAVLLLAAPALSAQDASEEIPAGRTFSGRAQVTAVDLIVDVRDQAGRVPADLGPDDFVVLEDGVEKQVVAVERFAEGTRVSPLGRGAVPAPSAIEEGAWTWHTVLYVDQVLSSSGSIRRAAEALGQQAGDLTRLGTFEVVAADPHPRVVLPATRSARLVEQTLLDLARDLPGRDAVGRARKRFADQLRLDYETGGTGQGIDRGASDLGARSRSGLNRRDLVWSTIVQEAVLLREQQDRLLTWTSNYLEEGPRALLLVNDGYDLDPRDFYLVGVDDLRTRSDLDSLLQAYSPVEGFRGLVQVMAASGWVCVNLALGSPSATFATMGAEISGKGYAGDIAGRSEQGQQGSPLPSQLFYRPLDGLRNLAKETGGELVTGKAKIPEAVDRLAERVRITYQVERLPDGAVHRVEVKPRRPGLTVNAPEWSGSPAPEAVSSARARRLLADAAEKGDLPVVAAVAVEQEDAGLKNRDRGTLQARVDFSAFSPEALPPSSALRVTFAVDLADQLPFVHHDVVQGQDLRGLEAWTYTLPVSLPPEAGKVAVLVEELSTGAWGGAVAARVSGPLPEVPEGRHTAAVVRGGAGGVGGDDRVVEGYDLPVDLLPDAKVLVLVPPFGEMVTGAVRFETLVTRPGVDRVELHLDGEPVATARRAPFSARVDLGDLPRPRTVEAIAYDAQGAELGRDSVIVNEGAGGTFRVRLIEPRRADQVGPVDVEAEVRVPPEETLERVEIAWNDERVATLYAPPFRQRVRVPPESPVGFITVTAHLADGTTAEDVVFMNGPGGDERVEVRLVELYTVVTDPQGRPILGLSETDFQVVEEGRRQQVAALKDGSELPLSLGLLLDSSASMADVLRPTQIAAIDFLFLTLDEDDRAFLVDFDSEPRLVQALTGDLETVGRRIVRLQPGGYTALCDALVFSLVQMQSVRGRRALVVLSDGAGREERVGYATCLRLAQQVGVPIYAIVLDRGGTERGRSERIESVAEAVGGRVFYVQSLDNLGSVYRTIRDELDSQYVVTYYPADTGDDDFRRVEVTVPQPGLTARTVSGYWP